MRNKAELLEAGYPEELIDQLIAWSTEQEKIISAGNCPRCGSPIRDEVDPRQVGTSQRNGSWVNYRCSAKCGWMLDSKREMPASGGRLCFDVGVGRTMEAIARGDHEPKG